MGNEDLIFQANYRAGLRILRVNNYATGDFEEIAYFDTYPSSNSANFNGAWSNYPFFPSGTIAISTIESGLFMVKPDLSSVYPTSSPTGPDTPSTPSPTTKPPTPSPTTKPPTPSPTTKPPTTGKPKCVDASGKFPITNKKGTKTKKVKCSGVGLKKCGWRTSDGKKLYKTCPVKCLPKLSEKQLAKLWCVHE